MGLHSKDQIRQMIKEHNIQSALKEFLQTHCIDLRIAFMRLLVSDNLADELWLFYTN